MDTSGEFACPHCEAPYVVGARQCPECGSELAGEPTVADEDEPTRKALLGGKFLIHDEVGRGAYGTVYQAEDTQLERPVAIKVFSTRSLEEDARVKFERRFRREARSAARLAHPNIVTIHEAGHTESIRYLVMEFVRGRTVGELLRTRTTIPWDELQPLADALLSALDYAHREGVVHRDIKPENLLIRYDGELKLTDFGIAKILHPDHHPTTHTEGKAIGTPSYMSPEQIQGRPVDGRADQYSAAVLLYESLTGRKPFESDTIAGLIYQVTHEEAVPADQVSDAVPPAVSRVLMRAMSKKPKERFATCAEFRDALAAAFKAPWTPVLEEAASPPASSPSENRSEPTERIPEDVEVLMETFRKGIDPEGFPAVVDAQGLPLPEPDLYLHLGRYAPALILAGGGDLARDLGRRTWERLSAQPDLTAGQARPRLLRRLTSVRLTDYTGLLKGFNLMHRLSSDPEPAEWARWLVDYLFAHHASRGHLASAVLPGKAPLDQPEVGGLIEAVLDTAALLGDEALLHRALGALNPFIQHDAFQQIGLCPSVMARGVERLSFSRTRRIDLQANTALAGALLRAFQATGKGIYADALHRFTREGLPRMRHPHGGYYRWARMVSAREIEPWGQVEASNHTILDVLVRAHRLLDVRDPLGQAIELANHWRGRAHSMTGLLPSADGSAESRVGLNLGFALAFRRLFLVTEDRAMASAHENLVDAVRSWHLTDGGVVAATYLGTGDPSDHTQDPRHLADLMRSILLPQQADPWDHESVWRPELD